MVRAAKGRVCSFFKTRHFQIQVSYVRRLDRSRGHQPEREVFGCSFNLRIYRKPLTYQELSLTVNALNLSGFFPNIGNAAEFVGQLINRPTRGSAGNRAAESASKRKQPYS